MGLADLLVGAPGASAAAGRSYVVFGKTSGTAVDLSAVAAGTGGVVVLGQSAGDQNGFSAAAASPNNAAVSAAGSLLHSGAVNPAANARVASLTGVKAAVCSPAPRHRRIARCGTLKSSRRCWAARA